MHSCLLPFVHKSASHSILNLISIVKSIYEYQAWNLHTDQSKRGWCNLLTGSYVTLRIHLMYSICLHSILSSLSYTLGIVQWHIYAVDCMVFERTCVQILGMQIFASHIHNFNTPLLNCCQRIYCTLFVSGPQCPLGTYVEQLSSGVLSCVTCPANSNSVETNSPECTCFNGYHRTNLEGPNIPCTCEWNNYYVAIFSLLIV